MLDLPILFVVLTHASLGSPVRLNSDNADYVYQGNTYLGVSLDFQIVSDDDQPPRAQLGIMNADRLVSNALLALTSAPTLSLTLLSSADFNMTVNPRTSIGTPVVQYQALSLRLTNIQGDSMIVTGDLGPPLDPTAEPFPGLNGTQARLPGLYR